MYPLKFRPVLKTVVWGGEKIAGFKGIDTARTNIGESWELSGVKGSESVVAYGPFAGRTISDLVSSYREKLVGKSVYARTGNEFPLLIKFIDAKQDLSIQVHPDDALASRWHNGARGKSEMWYVVSADKGASLISGLSETITPEEYERRVADNTVTDVLCRYPVHEGDVFFIPAGRIHSIGAGSFIVEIQETSDITYRIYDYGRPGLDGKPRELHTEQAKSAIDYRVHEDYRTRYVRKMNEEVSLVNCCHFNTSLLEMDEPFVKDMSGMDSFLAAVCIDGEGTVSDSEGNTVDISCGETVLIPACMSSAVFRPQGGRLQMLLTSCPSQI